MFAAARQSRAEIIHDSQLRLRQTLFRAHYLRF